MLTEAVQERVEQGRVQSIAARARQPLALRGLAVGCCAVGVVLGTLGCGQDSPTAPTPPTTPPQGNRSPAASGSIPDQHLTIRGGALSVDVASYFSDPDGDTLTYSAASSDTSVVTASVAGSTVTLTPVQSGSAAITVTARDPGGLTATQSIAATVASQPSSDDHGNTADAATPIAANSSTPGRLEPGDVDYFRLDLSTRTTLTAETTGSTDTVGQLEASDGSVLESDDDTAGSNFRIIQEVSAGTYYIRVRGYDGTVTGRYTLLVSSTEVPSENPDLVVESPAVSSASVPPDGSFTLSATVRNRGAGSAGSTVLRYYRSSDSTITTADTEVGTDAVSGLAANRTSSESISLRAPSSPGTYYYGGCADAVGGETDTGNNCSTGVRVVVSSSGDDHGDTRTAATSIPLGSRTPGTLEPGDTDYFRLDLSTSTTLTIETTGSTDTVGQLEARDGSVLASDDDTAVGSNFRIVRDVSAGTYYVRVRGYRGAAAGPYTLVVSGDETPSEAPDLVVEFPAVSSASVSPNESFTLSATVRNRGTGSAESTVLRYYRSSDFTITTADTEVGTDAVFGLAANRTSPESISLSAPSSTGAHYYGACVDAVGGESDTGNNCSTGVHLAVGSSSDDHGDTRATATSVGSNSRTPGTLDRGDVDYFRLDLPTRTTLTTETTGWINTVGALIASDGTVLESDRDSGGGGWNFKIVRDVSAGTYYIRVRGLDDTETGPYTLVVSSREVPAEVPDLVVESPAASASLAPNESFTLSATVRNRGTGAAAATTLRYYRSSDSTITTGDRAVGTGAVSGLRAGGSILESTSLRAPDSAGTYYYGACVDVVTGESNTDNNCSTSVRVVVISTSSNPDLVVESPQVSRDTMTVQDDFALRVIVRNRGGNAAESTTLRYYRSSDSNIATSDAEVGTRAVSALRANQEQWETITLSPRSAGTYWYGACVDAISGEDDTGNNCSIGRRVVVTRDSGILDAWRLTPSNTQVLEGEPFTLSATVRNSGDGTSRPTSLVLFRRPVNIIEEGRSTETSVRVPAIEGGETRVLSVTVTTSRVHGGKRWQYQACLTSIDDCTNYVFVTVTGRPDLIVEVESPFIASSPGSPLTRRFNVRNRGTATSREWTTLRTYQSTNDRLDIFRDTLVSTDRVGPVGSERTIAVRLQTPSEPGRYYYFACVDAVSGESRTDNNCSSASAVEVR